MKLSFRRWWPMKAARSRSMTSEKTRTFPKIYWKLHDHKPFKIRKWLCSVEMMRWLGRGSRIQLYVFGKVIEANWVNPISVCLINPAKSLENMNDHLGRLWRLCENIYIYKSIYIEFILSGGLDRPVWPVILYSFFCQNYIEYDSPASSTNRYIRCHANEKMRHARPYEWEEV